MWAEPDEARRHHMLRISRIIGHHQIDLLIAPGLYGLKSLLERSCLKVFLLNKLMFVFHRDFLSTKATQIFPDLSDHKIPGLPLLTS